MNYHALANFRNHCGNNGAWGIAHACDRSWLVVGHMHVARGGRRDPRHVHGHAMGVLLICASALDTAFGAYNWVTTPIFSGDITPPTRPAVGASPTRAAYPRCTADVASL